MASGKMDKKDKQVLVIAVIIAVVFIVILILVTQLNLFKSIDQNVPYEAPEEKGDYYVVYDGVKSNNSVEFRQTKKYGKYEIYGATLI